MTSNCSGTSPVSVLGGNQWVFFTMIATDENYNSQFAFGFNSDRIAIRRRMGGAWTEWKPSSVKSEVDALSNALAKDYGRIGDGKTYVESFQYLADMLPAGTPIMGTYNSSGAKVFWGYLYNERNYGMFEVINYTGNRATVILDNGTWKTV